MVTWNGMISIWKSEFTTFFFFLSEQIQKFLKRTFLRSVTEFWLTAGEGELRDGESGGQSHKVAVCVPHAGGVGCFWGGAWRETQLQSNEHYYYICYNDPPLYSLYCTFQGQEQERHVSQFRERQKTFSAFDTEYQKHNFNFPLNHWWRTMMITQNHHGLATSLNLISWDDMSLLFPLNQTVMMKHFLIFFFTSYNCVLHNAYHHFWVLGSCRHPAYTQAGLHTDPRSRQGRSNTAARGLQEQDRVHWLRVFTFVLRAAISHH